jgi:nitrate reductase gamma subunit
MNKYLNKEKWLLILSFILGVGMLYILWLVVSFFITSLTSADPTISAAIHFPPLHDDLQSFDSSTS